MIPAMIRKFVEAKESGRKEVVLWGDGSATREFLYVEDAADAVVAAAARYQGSEPVNLGSGDEISIRDLANLVAKEVGYEREIVWDTTKPNWQPRRKLDTSRAEKFFGWKASHRLSEGLRETIRFYRESRLN